MKRFILDPLNIMLVITVILAKFMTTASASVIVRPPASNYVNFRALAECERDIETRFTNTLVKLGHSTYKRGQVVRARQEYYRGTLSCNQLDNILANVNK